MASITLESSYQSTAKDMGDSHVKAHAHQHKYMQSSEPTIETLTDNQTSDNSIDLALQFAQENIGLMTPEQWRNYNAKQRKSRQKHNYTEYILGVSGNFTKAKERQLNNSKTPKKTREKISREMRAIIENAGLPINGSIYYLSNTESYDEMSPKELKAYRNFERETFKKFFNSSTFQALNPECFRAEIHYDEMGAMHLQTQDLWYHEDGRGRLTYAKRAIIKQTLSKWYKYDNVSGEEMLQHRLDVLCEFDEIAQKNSKKIGSKRADMMYLDYIKRFPLGQVDDALKANKDGSKRKYKHSSAERNTRIEELWRIEQMNALREIAENTAKSMNIDYQVDENYTTDGIHLDGAAYIAHKKASQKAQTAMSLANQVKNASQSVSDELKSTYKAISGEEPEEQSPLELANKIKSKVKAQQKASKDNQEKIKNQEQQLKEQEEKLTRLRNENRVIAQNNKRLQEEQKSLKNKVSKLKDEIKQLQARTKSAGRIIATWVTDNWSKLENHFQNYARTMNSADNERFRGGREGKGDPDLANRFEDEAKNGLIAGLSSVENEEWEKSGFSKKVLSANQNNTNNEKTTDLDK